MSSTTRMRRMRKRDRDRINQQHREGNHLDCQEGCSPENPDPNAPKVYTFPGHTGAEIADSYLRVTAGLFEPSDPRQKMIELGAAIARNIESEDVDADKWNLCGDILQQALWVTEGEAVPDSLEDIQLRHWQRIAAGKGLVDADRLAR